jgi:agmatinase
MADSGDHMTAQGARGFLGLTARYSDPDTSVFHVVPVPYEVSACYGVGSRFGPKAILDASAYIEPYDHRLEMETARAGIATQPEVAIDVGDPEVVLAGIEQRVASVVDAGGVPVVLGGEHTVSLGAVRALAERGGPAVVSIDAHADLRESYQGSGYSHACYLRRASEITECCALGVRSLSAEEADYASREGIPLVYAHRFAGDSSGWPDLGFIPEDIYISIDVDAFDPSVIPSTGTPEPGGLVWEQMVNLLETVVSGRRVMGFDVVELCPQAIDRAPDFTAAKLIYRMMGLILRNSTDREEEQVVYGQEG